MHQRWSGPKDQWGEGVEEEVEEEVGEGVGGATAVGGGGGRSYST